MSAVMLQSNALWHTDFTFFILLSFGGACFLLYTIKNQFSNELFARVTKMTNEFDAKINTTITAEIERIFSEINGKLTAELNTKISNELSTRDTKIANELSARLSEVNSTFTAGLVRNNSELNKKLMPLRRRKFYRWSIM